MASLLTFLKTPGRIRHDLHERNVLAEIRRKSQSLAARRIQAWFRGMITRAHLRVLDKMATVIQRHWRGYRVRSSSGDCFRSRVHQMWREHYDKMATRIQALWRGYWSRKTCSNLRGMWSWLEEVYRKNEQTLKNMEEFRVKEIERERRILEGESILWILFVLFKLHHLVGTKHRPGVISRIDEKYSTAIEEMLKCFRYRSYVLHRCESCEACPIDSKESLVLRGTHLERCEREIRKFEKDLREGNLPISRSHLYEDEEKIRKALNHLNQILRIENRKQVAFESPGSSNSSQTLSKHKNQTRTENYCPCQKQSSEKSIKVSKSKLVDSKTFGRKSLEICK